MRHGARRSGSAWSPWSRSAATFTAIRFAGKLAVDHHKVDDTLWSEMRQHFSEAEIIELVAHTTLYIGFGRFNEIVGLDPA